MENIKFNNSETKYVAVIRRIGNRIEIIFKGDAPTKYDSSSIRLVTDDDYEYAKYEGYIYTYRTLENGFVLSNIDERYVEPTIPEVHNEHPLEKYIPTAEEIAQQLAFAKEARQRENKNALANFLSANPITWTDGGIYGITQEDQNEMIADKAAYELKQALGETAWKLEWHTVHNACKEFTMEEFLGLLNAIVDFVYPYRRLQEEYKEKIYACTTVDELNAIELKYELPTTV